jgi:hypothetical protein
MSTPARKLLSYFIVFGISQLIIRENICQGIASATQIPFVFATL